MELHTLLESWRLAAGLSQPELAAAICRSERAIRGWENGSPCTADTVGAIGRACGVQLLPRLRAVLAAAGEDEDAAKLWAVLGDAGGLR